MRVLLLSAYEAVSHRYWADSLMANLSEVAWQTLSLPPRHFAWRIRGNPLSWWLKEHDTLSQSYDVVLATSMVDLATLLGLFPHLGRARKIVYFHENQFAYPESSDQMPQVEAKMVNLYAALAADTVVFNTAYNRDSFFTGVRAFLKKMPENLPAAKPLEALRSRARVLPVPISPLAETHTDGRVSRRIVWNHRWEYDKNPDDFFNTLIALSEKGIEFELAVLGQRFRQTPPIFDIAQEKLAAHNVAWGPQSEPQYRELLATAGIVVSTTWHEFQGLAIMEAAQRGALPLVPDRLCFPELYPDAYRYDGTPDGLYKRLHAWLSTPDSRPGEINTQAWEWPAWRDAYRALLQPGLSLPR
ncbi:tRNA-queuosine alpha-mannosyltransferase domain-containing protein [Halomonas sp. AOP30-A1-24]|uniref:tRNA-queuosine alpha-mannosyltransferase domain-containing protein n=1 Tax=unclassified Halomonas TaxID=2609666 RepID=UPI004034B8AD